MVVDFDWDLLRCFFCFGRKFVL